MSLSHRVFSPPTRGEVL